jgi:zinc transport system permease protein
MDAFLDALMTQTFLQNAFLGSLLASLACGIIGSYVVVRKIGYMAGGIAHAVLGGMGAVYFIGRNPVGGVPSSPPLLPCWSSAGSASTGVMKRTS